MIVCVVLYGDLEDFCLTIQQQYRWAATPSSGTSHKKRFRNSEGYLPMIYPGTVAYSQPQKHRPVGATHILVGSVVSNRRYFKGAEVFFFGGMRFEGWGGIHPSVGIVWWASKRRHNAC